MLRRLLPVLLLLPLLTPPLQAGPSSFWHRDPRPAPNERVPVLLRTLRTDGDESKRVAAAEELRQFDPAAFPEMIPVLIEVLQKDPKPSVRSEAAQTLARLRPVSQQIGQALEQARDKDPSMRVRVQARKELLGYHWHGYRSSKPEEGSPSTKEGGPTSKEPPLAPPVPVPPSPGNIVPPIATIPRGPVPQPVTGPALPLPAGERPVTAPDGAAPPPAQGPELPPPFESF